MGKKTLSNTSKILLGLIPLALIIFLIWYFRFLVTCFCLSIVISFIGRPLMDILEQLKFRKRRLNQTLAAALTLSAIVFVFGLLTYLAVPLIAKQAIAFSDLDISKISEYYAEPISKTEAFLQHYQLIKEDQHIEDLVTSKIMSVIEYVDIHTLVNNGLHFAGNVIFGFFVILFVTFFLLKDANLLYTLVEMSVADKYLKEAERIMKNSRHLISRYFIGICLEIIAVSLLLSLGFYTMSLPTPLLLGVIGGGLVILPYIGGFIGGFLGLMLCLTGSLGIDPSIDIMPIILKFLAVFVSVKLIDDFILQPLIYSQSVKAHPLEIFFVILVAGEIAGISGMILAIPTYTFLRIIAKEFLSKWKFVQKLTKDI